MDPASFKISLDELMTTFYQRMDSFEGKLKKAPTTNSTETLAMEFSTFKTFVSKSLRALQEQIEWLAKQTDQLEMRGRRKILLLHGLAEESKEDVSAVVKTSVVGQLKLTSFTVADISRCHRMGRVGSPDKPRPILCKLRDVSVRDKIWAAKTKLKGTGITISEFLTKTRHSLFMAARQRFGIPNCWTRGGYVFVLDSDGARHRLNNLSDLDVIGKVSHKPTKEATVAPTKQKRTAARK